ncbi:MAG: hypothetical protein A3C93_00960 [Candidatus Lloydbacteria bacterium RIFCSPHIGHO2_02_FULL_54_17]|uniref:HIT domain-containing protein n=1 Tax=Candidatus Lloydbacteria bacterium RIFCSPHIGHO2_02_FULL_54_17 TaxID=1798664 RepID=A0A1G2DD36_9BACT|nr:MAG: hypothetical protein A2762_01535 [Candidatus Lloydbacteria bacterium RIFCSPHIGHO2_01_FULL_54_11]OGZ11557.1 MAG: hypothetical protein A3C93_00960 [Candidatus Lloydbacteria bacterium RIFCSPHIGHO2_02_FULL_54_17]OGZ14839.1 MAG: hypothetical protein A3H76_05155 [Candidatus Lloydbacteria bacterium RIFCSPLOWO2_02_FULL_54_12]
MTSLRKPETAARYEEYRKKREPDVCYLCRAASIKEFTYWRLLPNEYPYDRITKTHHLITLRRHADENALTVPEYNELYDIKLALRNDYDMLFENTLKNKSIREHYHIHAIEVADELP